MSALNHGKPKKLGRPAVGIIFSVCLSAFVFICLHLTGSTPTPFKPDRTELGSEAFLDDYPTQLKGKRLGLVINHTSRLPGGLSLVQALLDKGADIRAIFSPEHGFQGEIEQGQTVPDSLFKNIKIFSLYGKTRKPTAAQSQAIDIFIFDIQDVGTRFYTYITTLKYVIEAAAEFERPVYVLDRPNPTGGLIVEGPCLRPKFESFIGALPIPVRYGLTIGELAKMMVGEKWVQNPADLQVIRMKNWRRSSFWKDTGLPWTPTSPNIPTPETTILFPGTGLLGALKINHGLGTPSPFLQIGAPWLEPELIIRRLQGGREFGVEIEATAYTPRSLPGIVLHPPFEKNLCQGLRIHVRQPEKCFSLRMTLAFIKVLKEVYPERIAPQAEPLNLHFGSDLLLRYLEGKISFSQLMSQMEQDERLFKKKREKYLLYE